MPLNRTNLTIQKRFNKLIPSITDNKTKANLIHLFYQSIYPTYLINKKSLYYSLSLFIGGNVRAYRMLWGYPVRGQRTWSNANTNQKVNNVVFNLKFNKFSKFNSKVNVTKMLFVAEYINLFWQQQWFLEWFSMYKKLQFIPLHVKKRNLVELNSVVNFNINHNFNYNLSTKKKSHKRKRVFPKNKISTGMPFFFSKVYKSNLTKI